MTSEAPEGPWVLAQGECDGKPMLARINSGAAPLAGDPRFARRIDVCVPHRAPNPSGFPRADEAFAIGEIEDQLVTALTRGGAGVFVLAITTGGLTELVFYVTAAGAAVAAVEQLARAVQGHELQHEVEDDPRWEVFQQFAQASEPPPLAAPAR